MIFQMNSSLDDAMILNEMDKNEEKKQRKQTTTKRSIILPGTMSRFKC